MLPDPSLISPTPQELRNMELGFRILHVKGQPKEIYVPSCVQFKIKNFTDVNFQNLSAQVNGVLCVNFFIFTHNKDLENMLLERLYWNPLEQVQLERNRKKKIERTANFLPVTFNKDITVKLPTTRSKQFQIQAFKSRITYDKGGIKVDGWRIFHLIRKEFTIEIIKGSFADQFWAPYNFINLDLTVSLDHMEVEKFDYPEPKAEEKKIEKQRYRNYMEHQKKYIMNVNKLVDQKTNEEAELLIKKVYFNNLRLEEPMRDQRLDPNTKMAKLAPMITNSAMNYFGKYDVADTYMEAYTYDEREVIDLESQRRELVFNDSQPTQLEFKPFKYAIFKIPLYRFPVVDMMTIFIPIWLLGFISVYVFYQTTEIMNRIINVAALMIAYAAVQPIVRQNLPDATTLTLVDLLIYMEIITNILFLARSISIRNFFDDDTLTSDITITNTGYDRWSDSLFIASVALTIANVVIVTIMIFVYLYRKRSYKAGPITRKPFSISKEQNWSLKLLMDRAFARYKQQLIPLDNNGIKVQKEGSKIKI